MGGAHRERADFTGTLWLEGQVGAAKTLQRQGWGRVGAGWKRRWLGGGIVGGEGLLVEGVVAAFEE